MVWTPGPLPVRYTEYTNRILLRLLQGRVRGCIQVDGMLWEGEHARVLQEIRAIILGDARLLAQSLDPQYTSVYLPLMSR